MPKDSQFWRKLRFYAREKQRSKEHQKPMRGLHFFFLEQITIINTSIDVHVLLMT